MAGMWFTDESVVSSCVAGRLGEKSVEYFDTLSKVIYKTTK